MGKLHNLHMRIGLLLMICVLTAGCSPVSEGESSQISESEENSQESMTDLSSAPEESEADPVPQAGGELSMTVQKSTDPQPSADRR